MHIYRHNTIDDYDVCIIYEYTYINNFVVVVIFRYFVFLLIFFAFGDLCEQQQKENNVYMKH